MSTPSSSQTDANLSRLRIDPARKQRGRNGPLLLLLLVAGTLAVAGVVFFKTRGADRQPVAVTSAGNATSSAGAKSAPPQTAERARPGDVVLTMSGYVIPHFDSRAAGNVDAPLFKVDWLFENRLEYRVGRLTLLGTVRWAGVQNQGTNFAVFVRAQRSFGAL